jgi:oligoendopeptidase F
LLAPIAEGLTDRYETAVRSLQAAPIHTAAGMLDPIKDARSLARDPDRAVRKAGADALRQAFDAHGEMFTATLIDTARLATGSAKLRSYASAPAQIYAESLQLTEDQVRSTLAAMTRNAGVLKDYQRVRAAQVTRMTGIQDVHSWDLERSSGYQPASLTYSQAQGLLLRALKPLGQEYLAQFQWLLDPTNGALEIAGGPDRKLDGFSLGFAGVPVMLYVYGFDGTLSTAATVIHEGGHAINTRLAATAGVAAYYVQGPKFLQEAYALLNEFLLWDELVREGRTPQERAFYQEGFLGKLIFEVFTSAEEGSLEQALYDGVAAGTIRTQADIDSLNAGILEQYELFAAAEPALRTGWQRKRLLFQDPLYLVNYLYAALTACKLYEMDQADPAGFQKRYLALLREGFDAPAADLIKRNMGFSLDSEQLIGGALQLIRERTAALQRQYLLLQPQAARGSGAGGR